MKVAQLIESEWLNKGVTLKYLWKKQLSACHRFVIMAEQIGFYNELHAEIAIKYLSRTSISILGALRETLKEDIKYKSLIDYYNQMEKAKQNYEQAGGRYEGK